MAQKKTLQVFVSSTSIDWQEERPAAVEAMLTASPMLADMELFTVGDQSQMYVMKRWIEASTVPCGPCRGGVGPCQETRDDAS
jgi:hypothetical protein